MVLFLGPFGYQPHLQRPYGLTYGFLQRTASCVNYLQAWHVQHVHAPQSVGPRRLNLKHLLGRFLQLLAEALLEVGRVLREAVIDLVRQNTRQYGDESENGRHAITHRISDCRVRLGTPPEGCQVPEGLPPPRWQRYQHCRHHRIQKALGEFDICQPNPVKCAASSVG